MNDVMEEIKTEIQNNDVVLFMKGTPDRPLCGFSGVVVKILNLLGVPFKGIDVLKDEGVRQAIKEYTDWPTIPQLYIRGEFVGGCDIAREMYESGELKELLKNKGLL